MNAAQAHRGETSGLHADGPVALGLVDRPATPGARAERQPLVTESGLVIAADARLDNRGELISQLRLPDGATLTDAHLIVSAYERWGAGAPARLVGAFAFVVWDPRNRTLFCARDHLGLRPFSYVLRAGQFFVFASEIKSLHAVDGVERVANEAILIAYLDGRQLGQGESFYEGVARLPPAHHLTVDPNGTRLERYWRLDRERELRLPRPEQYVEAFRECFDEAVAARLRSAGTVGAMLSGGLDSSSVAATALALGGGPVPTFSFTFEGIRASDERVFQQLVTDSGSYEPHRIEGEALNPFDEFDRLLFLADEPSDAANLFLNVAAWRAASRSGTPVILDGFFGDSAVSYGDDRIAELLRAGRLTTWLREIRARARVESGGRSMVKSLIVSSLRTVLPQAPAAGTKELAKSDRAPVFVPLNASAAGRLAAPVLQDDDRFHTVRERQIGDIEHEAYTPLFEVMNKVATGTGIDVRFPFADRRLLELSVSMPSEAKQRDGWDRWMLRSAMAGRLPDTVRWRTGKADLFPNLGQAIRGAGRARLSAELDDPEGPLARFVDRDSITSLLRRLDEGDLEPAGPLWAATCASAWLRSFESNASTPPRTPQTGPHPEA
jgi:asparagine synthase (glutamine-hydrolysing)